MKKFIIATAIAMAIICAACAKKEAEQPAEPEVQETAEENKSAGLPNPMVEKTKDEMTAAGFEFNVPDGATNVKYFIIDGKLGEMQFEFNTLRCSARIQSTEKYEDISGMYFTWDSTEKGKVGYSEADLMFFKGTEESAQCIMWYDAAPGLMYCVSAIGKDMDGFDIQAIAEQTYVQTQGDVG